MLMALSYIYKTENVCLSVCVYVSLFLMRGHSFEWICMKFGMWHPYTIQMAQGRGVSKHHSNLQACALFAVHTLLQFCADCGHLTSRAQN